MSAALVAGAGGRRKAGGAFVRREADTVGRPLGDERQADVAVIGAGPAGLTAAYLLSKAGKRVVVLDQDRQYVGGIARTVDYNGFLFDIGGHRFFSKSNEVNRLWDEILPDDFVTCSRLTRILYGGEFYSYPLKAFEAFVNLGPLTSLACAMSYFWARMTPVRRPRTFHEWVRNQFGERLFSIFFRTYTEKVWGMSCDEISANWAAQRIKGLNLVRAVLNGITRSLRLRPLPARKPVVKTLIESFRYPRRGPGMLWQEAARKTAALGGDVRLGRRVTALVYDADAAQWMVHAQTAAGAQEICRAAHVVSSAAIRDLVAMLAPAPAARVHAEKLRYRDFLVVTLIIKGADLFPDNWIYIHDPSVKVGRIVNFRNWSSEMVPDPTLSSLGMEYFCFEGDDLWTADDRDLIALAKRELGKIGLADPACVIDGVVVRQPKAYPVYDEHYVGHVAAVRAELETRFPTLHLVGRNGMHKYNNQDHAMMTAMLTVENILAGACKYDVWNVNEDAEYHEAGASSEAFGSVRLVPARVPAAG
jgi:protoporphyrinogen oxidase